MNRFTTYAMMAERYARATQSSRNKISKRVAEMTEEERDTRRRRISEQRDAIDKVYKVAQEA
jgi:hypothetical protein